MGLPSSTHMLLTKIFVVSKNILALKFLTPCSKRRQSFRALCCYGLSHPLGKISEPLLHCSSPCFSFFLFFFPYKPSTGWGDRFGSSQFIIPSGETLPCEWAGARVIKAQYSLPHLGSMDYLPLDRKLSKGRKPLSFCGTLLECNVDKKYCLPFR